MNLACAMVFNTRFQDSADLHQEGMKRLSFMQHIH